MKYTIRQVKNALVEASFHNKRKETVSIEFKESLILHFLKSNYFNFGKQYYNPIGDLAKILEPDYTFYFECLYNIQTKLQLSLEENPPDVLVTLAIRDYPYDLVHEIKKTANRSKTDLDYIITISDLIQFLPWNILVNDIDFNRSVSLDEATSVWEELILNDILHYFKCKIRKHIEGPAIIDQTTLLFFKGLVHKLTPGQIFYLIDLKMEKAHQTLIKNFYFQGNLGRLCKEEIELEIQNCMHNKQPIISLEKRPIEFPMPILQDFFFMNYFKGPFNPFHYTVMFSNSTNKSVSRQE